MLSGSSAILCTTSQANTRMQDNEFFSISILLNDLFAIFSIYKILVNSRSGEVHFFKVYPCVNFFCRSHDYIHNQSGIFFINFVKFDVNVFGCFLVV